MKEMKIKSVMFTADQIQDIVNKLADEINADYKNEEEVTVICVLKGSTIFTSDLIRRLNISKVFLSFIRASSYGCSDVSSGDVEIITTDDLEITGKNIIVVEDIVDSGFTLSLLTKKFKEQNPKSLKVCSLFDKPDRRVSNFSADYIGVKIPDEFIVGYGLDYAEMYRQLPYVAILEEA